ncbi:MAG: four helix bundle protein [Chloroflexota bacterium]|nr:four helix bundle protein [Chloroflexota bacterium]
MADRIRTHNELEVYQKAFDAAMRVFELSKGFPVEELYSLTDQIRRSSRSVCANLAEAWRWRRDEEAFISRLNEVESQVAETQVWLEFAVKSGYADRDEAADLYKSYDAIMRTIVGMINDPETWLIK